MCTHTDMCTHSLFGSLHPKNVTSSCDTFGWRKPSKKKSLFYLIAAHSALMNVPCEGYLFLLVKNVNRNYLQDTYVFKCLYIKKEKHGILKQLSYGIFWTLINRWRYQCRKLTLILHTLIISQSLNEDLNALLILSRLASLLFPQTWKQPVLWTHLLGVLPVTALSFRVTGQVPLLKGTTGRENHFNRFSAPSLPGNVIACVLNTAKLSLLSSAVTPHTTASRTRSPHLTCSHCNKRRLGDAHPEKKRFWTSFQVLMRN